MSQNKSVEEVVEAWLEEEKKDNYVAGSLETSYTLDGIFDVSNLVENLRQTSQEREREIVEEKIYTQKQFDDRVQQYRGICVKCSCEYDTRKILGELIHLISNVDKITRYGMIKLIKSMAKEHNITLTNPNKD